MDLLPSLLDLLEVSRPAEASFQGESLAPLILGERRDRGDGVEFATSRCNPKLYGSRGYDLDRSRRIHTVRSTRWKLVAFPGVEHDYYELFDLETDPFERHNVLDEYPNLAQKMVDSLQAWLATAREQDGEDVELSSEELEQMRALGYLE